MELTLTLGILLAAGVLGNAATYVVRLPKVTLYILAGLLLGPSVAGLLVEEHLEELDPVLRLALALVLLDLGSRFTVGALRGIVRRVLPLSLGELGFTFACVTVGLLLIGEEPSAAVLLGGLALATAPATTILVLREYDSEGPLTDYTYALVALNNLAAIVCFELLFVLVSAIGGSPEIAPLERLAWLGTDLIGSLALGAVGGLLISYAAGQLTGGARSLAVFALVTVALGVCETWDMPYLLCFLAMGTTLANTSEFARQVIGQLEPVAALLYVVFFTAAGAELDIAALTAAGTVGVAYIVLRCLGKYVGIRTVARMRRESDSVQQWLGCTLIAQAGAAIGLVQVAEKHDPMLGGHLYTIIVGTVVFFELAGPLLTRMAVVRGGEVPLVHVVQPYRPSWWRGIWEMLSYLRGTIGVDPFRGRDSGKLTVQDLMRRNVKALLNTDNFVRVLEFIEQSRHQTYPVVDSEGILRGVIRYRWIHSALFDRDVSNLVLAEDLSVAVHQRLLPDQSLDEALALFESIPDDAVPVVASAEEPTLVGMVERRDVMRVLKHRHEAGNEVGAAT